MEAWVKDIDFSEKTKVVNLSSDERIVLERVEDDAEHHNLVENEGDHNHTHVHAYDPHYWIYPVYAIYMVEQIRDILLNSIQDPYEMIGLAMINNANKYIEALNKIDHQLQYIANNATNEASAVAIRIACASIPVAERMLGLTARIYAMVINVVKPASTSVFTSVLFSLSLKNFSNMIYPPV